MSFGHNVVVGPNASLKSNGGGRIALGKNVTVSRGAILQTWGGSITVSDNVWLGPYVVVYGQGGVTIGKETQIATGVVIVAANHGISATTVPIRLQAETRQGIAVGADVWIAANATILDGVTVGEGAVVAAGAVVNRDVGPGCIVGGVPARQIGLRSG